MTSSRPRAPRSPPEGRRSQELPQGDRALAGTAPPRAPALGLQAQQVLALQRSAGNQATVAALGRARTPVVQRAETGSGLDDPLFMEDKHWSSGQGPDDRVTGRRLQNWAIVCGSAVVRAPFTLERMQEKERGAESDIMTDIFALLTDLLRGQSSWTTSHIVAGSTRYPYDADAETAVRTLGKLGRFTGSDNARERAVLELSDHWGPIERFLTQELLRLQDDRVLAALGRTPKDMELVMDAQEIVRLRTKRLHGHEMVIDQGLAGEFIVRAGSHLGHVTVADVELTLGTRSTGGGLVWCFVDGHPEWYYKAGAGLFNRQTIIGAVAADVARNAQFAAQLFPFMLRAAGLAATFVPNPVFIIAGVVLDELGEEGQRMLEDKGRSAGDISTDAAKEILINLVLHKIGGGEAKGLRGTAELELAAEKAAKAAGGAVKREIVRTEGPAVVGAVERGEGRLVQDAALRDEGYVFEVEIHHEGGVHTYRRTKGGKWCRWTIKICDTNPGLGVDKAADEQIAKLEAKEPAAAAPEAKPAEPAHEPAAPEHAAKEPAAEPVKEPKTPEPVASGPDAARQLTVADVTAGMEVDATQVKMFRGGDAFELKPGEFKVDKKSGLVQPTQGPSLDISALNPNVASRGARQLKAVPAELKIIQRASKLNHFEVVPRLPMTPERFQELLHQIALW